jgi:putative heme-binding domain-containing protein
MRFAHASSEPEILSRKMLTQFMNGTLATALGLWLAAAGLGLGQPIDTNRLALQVEALKRLKGTDFESKPALKAAVLKVLDATRGSAQYVELVRELKIGGQSGPLLDYASQHPAEASGVDALRLVLTDGDTALIRNALTGPGAPGLIQALGNTGGKEAANLLLPLASKSPPDSTLSATAVRALAQTPDGATLLLESIANRALPEPMQTLAASELRRSTWPEIKAKVGELVPATVVPSAEPLPPIAVLTRRTGDAAKGAVVFRRETVGCVRCHQIDGEGTDFGPNLSEIGTKLAKEAIYEAILDPSAGIAFGYEAWEIELKNGDEAYGLLASETADELAIKSQSGIVSRYRKSDIARRVQQKTSIMPAGLADTMSQQDLVDLVEYLSSRKKR